MIISSIRCVVLSTEHLSRCCPNVPLGEFPHREGTWERHPWKVPEPVSSARLLEPVGLDWSLALLKGSFAREWKLEPGTCQL